MASVTNTLRAEWVIVLKGAARIELEDRTGEAEVSKAVWQRPEVVVRNLSWMLFKMLGSTSLPPLHPVLINWVPPAAITATQHCWRLSGSD
jgi:hypothetical protein